ncbi:MAG: nicotinate phosphoribosyltransferase [candidate division WOR-3 bacterium]|nr:MAG: nicotinate phosphoribosyltransferase [candidate division WOR-3 bacterium]
MRNFALLTDMYELTMIQGYYFSNPNQEAVFDMFFRRQPFDGGFTIFAGLDPLIDAISSIRFTDEEIAYLDSLGLFKPEFLHYLGKFKFTGDIYSVKEGTVVFPHEPLLRVQGPLIEAQFLESVILNFINFQSLIATKTARIVIASGNGAIIEFGLRRAHGSDGAISAARAAFIGGAFATSNVHAGKMFNIPVRGTMAHSWVMSFNTERDAFENYAELYPEQCVLLVDTFDTLKSGVPNAIHVFKKLKKKGIKDFGIRLDSGDLEYLSKEARRMFDEAGLREVKIYASNELDEWIIHQIIENGAPIDAWGVGTKLVTADKDPSLTGVYKIVATNDGRGFQPRLKISNNPEKITNPGIKNTYRFYDNDDKMIADLICLDEEDLSEKIERKESLRFNHPSINYAHFMLRDYAHATKLLHPVILKGKRVDRSPSLQDIQNFTKSQINSLDATYKRLLNPHIYKVSLSNDLKELKQNLIKEYCAMFNNERR